MNKRLNTVLFVVGATIFNLFSMAVIFIALFMLYARFVGPSLSPRMNQFLTLWLFFGSVALAYWVYSRIVRWAEQRIDFHRYLEPIFARKPHAHGASSSAQKAQPAPHGDPPPAETPPAASEAEAESEAAEDES